MFSCSYMFFISFLCVYFFLYVFIGSYLLLFFSVQVRSMSPASPRRISHVPVHVVVLDKNDNSPMFVNTPYYGVVPVDSKRNSVVFKVRFTTYFNFDEKKKHYIFRIPTQISTGRSRRCNFAKLGQETVSPWSIVSCCPRVLQMFPTMWDSSQVSQSQLPDIVGSTCNTLGQRGTMLHGDTVPRSKVASSKPTLRIHG